jgi:hypothetical protein
MAASQMSAGNKEIHGFVDKDLAEQVVNHS